MARLNRHVRNILKVHDLATKQEVIDGLSWYRDAQEDSIRFTGFELTQAVGIVAALSPQKRWEVNLRIAGQFVQSGGLDSVQTGDQQRKARLILSGLHPLHALTGAKETEFFRCLFDPSDDYHVCLDRHAMSIWTGHKTVKTPNEGPSREAIRNDYRHAAGLLGILPNQIQAITWLAWRRLHPQSEKIVKRIKKVS